MPWYGFINRQFEAITDYVTRYDERIFPIDLKKISASVVSMCRNELIPIVAVGSGASEVLEGLPEGREIIQQSVQVVCESRDRTQRELVASPVQRTGQDYYFVDDVAVSGNTLRTALNAAQSSIDDQVIVGLEFDSRQLRQRVGLPLRSAITYKQLGGGRPAMNSVSTLLTDATLTAEYAQVKGVDLGLLQTVKKLYREEI